MAAPLERGPRRRRRRLWRLVPLVLLVAWLAFLVVAPLHAWSSVSRVDDAPAGDRPAETPGNTYLLVGSDSRDDLTAEQRRELGTGNAEGRRTDSIMLVHVPSGGGKSAIISIPRDSYMPIPGHNSNKVNAAYSIGGPQLLVQTLEQVTDLRIDGYLEIGFGGFASVVDSLGGVDICVPFDMDDPKAHINLAKGCQTLDGKNALGFVRARYSDPRGDIGRAERQRQFLAAIMKGAATPSTVLNPFRYWSFTHTAAGAVGVGEDTVAARRGQHPARHARRRQRLDAQPHRAHPGRQLPDRGRVVGQVGHRARPGSCSRCCARTSRSRRPRPAPTASPRRLSRPPGWAAAYVRSALEQLAGHDDALDLVGALVDLGDLGVAHHPLEREVAGVAGAAEQLDRVGGDLHGDVGGEALGGRAEEGQVGVAALGLGGGDVDHLARGLELHRHVGEHELDALEVGDVLAELLALLDVAVAWSSAPCAMPTAWAPIVTRVWSRVRSAILRPSPGAPTMRSPGMRTLSKSSSRVGLPLMPSLRSFSPNVKPSSDFSTTKALMLLPRAPSGSVTARTV